MVNSNTESLVMHSILNTTQSSDTDTRHLTSGHQTLSKPRLIDESETLQKGCINISYNVTKRKKMHVM